MRATWPIWILGAVGVLAACSKDDAAVTRGADAGTVEPGINDTGQGAGTGTETGLPCDVQQVLENRCIGCHLGPSPSRLLTRDDLLKATARDPAKTLAQLSVERMKETGTTRMPPAPAQLATFNETAALEAWVTAGSPTGASCTSSGGQGGGDPNAALVCTSNKTWSNGDAKSSLMHPGGACLTCHSARGGPAFSVAGTVYPTAHETDDCNGSDGSALPLTVTITDRNGSVVDMPVNAAGNFFSATEIFPPYQVTVSDGIKQRTMNAPLSSGDCNSCHTARGVNGAPGRIMAP